MASMTTRLPRPLLRGCRGGVVAAHPLAVTAGDDVLRAGGNAVDAAVAAAAALAVVAPDQCGLGGDALLLVREPDGAVAAYVGAAAVPRRPILPVTAYGPASAGVPGAVAAWCAAHEASGHLPLADVLGPATDLALTGFPVSDWLAGARDRRAGRLDDGAPGWPLLTARPGDVWRQGALAETLEAVRADGVDGFYRGPVAEAIERAVTTGGDGIDRDDLAAYAVAAEAPVTGTHASARLAVTPPPSQAALALLALDALRDAPPPRTVAGEHAAIEAIKHAFERREDLRTAGGAERVRARPLAAAPARASDLRGPTAADHTAAVTAADGEGLVVSMLVSVFHEFGSGVLVPEGGFVLNNRLSGLVGADALPPGGSRALHTLSPMLLEHDVQGVLAMATPGADGQVQILVQLARLVLDAAVPVAEALDAPRWRAVRGSVLCEQSFDPALADGLAALGHAVERRPDGHPLFGAAAVAGLDARTGTVVCGTDPRREVWGAVR